MSMCVREKEKGPKRSPATNAVAFLGWPPGSIVKIVTGKRANVTQFHRQGCVVSGSCGDELALIFTIMEFPFCYGKVRRLQPIPG